MKKVTKKSSLTILVHPLRFSGGTKGTRPFHWAQTAFRPIRLFKLLYAILYKPLAFRRLQESNRRAFVDQLFPKRLRLNIINVLPMN